MTKDEALKLALEAMEYADACLKKQLTMKYKHEYAQDLLLEAGTAIKEALAQPEPVAWEQFYPEMGKPQLIPPQRTWIGLTDEEILSISADCASSHQHTDIHFARAIEAKLRSKNESKN